LSWSYRRALLLFVVAVALISPTGVHGQEPLGLEAYVQIVLRSHPGARQASALESAARAERKAAHQIPDPTVELSWDRASPPDRLNARATERALSVAQTIPWPGTFSANARAGDSAARALGAEGTSARWDLEIEARTAYARLLYAHLALDVARAAEADAVGLRDLTTRRADLGEAREVDRIKAEVEWLRQQRTRRALDREAETAEAVVRTIAVEPLPQPLVLSGELPRSMGPLEPAALQERLTRANPRLAAARAEADRRTALLSVSRRARIPDLDVTWFRNREVDKDANGFSVGVRVPLWNANRGEIARATAAAALGSATAERTLLDLSSALERARQELGIASTQAEMIDRDILPAATRSLELARFSYQEGETSLLDLLDAQRTFRETQREAIASRLALALALADVQRLVGPDFNPGR
jgi:cobalt-zinc-cadmium efflux system outer membrane protein